jgi:predicted metal-dependent hydrolase
MLTEETLEELLDLTKQERNLFTVRNSKRARRLIFNSSVKKGLEVVLPRNYEDNWVREVVTGRGPWIRNRLSELNSERSLLTPGTVELKAIGSSYEITYQSLEVVGISGKGNGEIFVSPVPGDIFSASRILQGWLQEIAVTYLPPLLEETAESLGLSFNRVTVRRQKTRWGSCSIKKNINLNRNLLFMPSEIVEYVIYHELTHLKVLDHSLKFWNELETVFPNAQSQKAYLRNLERSAVPVWATV